MPARTDRTDDASILADLLVARRAQAYYARQLRGLADEQLDEPSDVNGWSRRRLVAHVALDARALTRSTEWVETRVYEPMWSSPTERDEVEAFTATLPSQALRNLAQHTAIHLDVEWRDLRPAAWDERVPSLDVQAIELRATVPARSRTLWWAAVGLGNGGRIEDAPDVIRRALRGA